MAIIINVLSSAETVEGQGVASAGREQINLIKETLSDKFTVIEGSKKQADITHYHTINPSYYVKIPHAKKNGKTVGYVHFTPDTVKESLKMPKIARFSFNKYMISFYKSMDALVVVNPYFIDKLEELGVDRNKVHYIPNFVSEEKFNVLSKPQKDSIRDELGIDKDAFVVLSVGQLQIRKGIIDFVEIARRMPHITFVWAGGFSFGKITAGYHEIKAILDNPPENIKFLGIIPREKMNEIYNMADVMFLASFEELFPMAILESMNCNVPILLRDIDLYKNILFDFYLKSDNVDGFVEEIERLKTDTIYYDHAKNLSKKGHEFYGREHVSHMWDEFYSNLIK